MTRFATRLSAPILALALLTGAAQALSIAIDMPTLTFPSETVTASTKSCEAGTAVPCTTDK